MGDKLTKTAMIGLAIGLIGEGSKLVSSGNLKQGGMMLAVGILLVGGYEVMQEYQVKQVAGDFFRTEPEVKEESSKDKGKN